jgi:hypothetical protein
MNTSHVWIVSDGELGQGGSVLAVFRTRKRATDHVTLVRPDYALAFAGDRWSEYRDGNDWVRIARHEIR